jgi:hypothetical protein
MRRRSTVALLAALIVMTMTLGASAAFAGEWNKGHFDAPGGDLPAKANSNSECLFNGQDEPDATEGTGPFADDGLWGSTPAGAHNQADIRVQSGGQIVAAAGPEGNAGVQGVACNGHLSPLK